MGGFGFASDDDLFIGPWSFGSEKMKKKEKKKKKTPKGIIIILILTIVIVLVAKHGVNPISLLQGNTSGSNTVEESNNDEYSEGGDTQYPAFTKKGYYTDKYIVELGFLDTVTLNDSNYYMLNLVLKTDGAQNLNILSPTKEIVIYNTGERKDDIKVTVPVSKELKLNFPFRPLTSFSREFIPIFIYSNDESSYDFLFIKTDVDKNSSLPPNVKGSVSLNVNGITHAELVQDNVILAKFKIYASTGGKEYAFGTIVEIKLPDDFYEFTKSGSNIIMVPTLSPEYTLNLYIVKKTGEFMEGDTIKATITLRDGDGLLIQKPTTIIVES